MHRSRGELSRVNRQTTFQKTNRGTFSECQWRAFINIFGHTRQLYTEREEKAVNNDHCHFRRQLDH